MDQGILICPGPNELPKICSNKKKVIDPSKYNLLSFFEHFNIFEYILKMSSQV